MDNTRQECSLKLVQAHSSRCCRIDGAAIVYPLELNATKKALRKISAKMGPKQDDWLRLFMASGMNHCGGGLEFAVVQAMDAWRDQGKAPNQITAYCVTNDRVYMSRPRCPYPQIAMYKGPT